MRAGLYGPAPRLPSSAPRDSLRLRALDAARPLCAAARDRLVPPRRLDFVGHGDFVATGDEFLAHFVELGGLQPDERVLDVGCGIGRHGAPAGRLPERRGLLRRASTSTATASAGAGGATGAIANFHFRVADLFNAPLQPARRARDRRLPLPVRRRRASTSCILTSVFTHLLEDEAEHYLAETAPRARARRPAVRDVLPARRHVARARSPRRRRGLPFLDARRARGGRRARRCPRRPSPTTTSGCSRRCAARASSSTGLHPGSWCGREEFVSLPGHRGGAARCVRSTSSTWARRASSAATRSTTCIVDPGPESTLDTLLAALGD